MILDDEIECKGRIPAWSPRVEVADGLRWVDLLHTATKTLLLLEEGLIVFAARGKTRGV